MQLTIEQIYKETRYFLPLRFDEIVSIEIATSGDLLEFNQWNNYPSDSTTFQMLIGRSLESGSLTILKLGEGLRLQDGEIEGINN